MSGPEVPAHLRAFVKLHAEVEGVIQHVGLDTWDVLLVDVTGLWDRDEFGSKDDALEACRRLGIRCREGWDDVRLTRRMNSRDHWGAPDGQRRAL